jgi:hypothetical protein
MSEIFHQERVGSFQELPRVGEAWEYQIRPNYYVPCVILRIQSHNGNNRYVAQYIDCHGHVKAGLVDYCNLRPVI